MPTPLTVLGDLPYIEHRVVQREMTVPLTLASGNRARTSTSTALVGPGNETERGSQSQSGYTGSDDAFNTETCDTENTQNAVEPKKSQER